MNGRNQNDSRARGLGLVDARGLLEAIWPDKSCRPSLRWIRKLQKERQIPFLKAGHFVFFDPQRVREALDKRCTVKARPAPQQKTPSTRAVRE